MNEERKAHRAAAMSLGLGALANAALISAWVGISHLGGLILPVVVAGTSIILGSLALFKISKSGGQFGGKGMAAAGIALSVLSMLGLGWVILTLVMTLG